MKKLLFILGVIATGLLSGCMSAQQMREQNIAQNYQLFSSFSQDVQEKIRLGQIDLGFTQQMVMLAWGEPSREYIRTTKKGVVVVWTYTRNRRYPKSELMSIPIYYTDSNGKRRLDYQSVWVNRDTKEEYAVARVEYRDGVVSAIEQLNQ